MNFLDKGALFKAGLRNATKLLSSQKTVAFLGVAAAIVQLCVSIEEYKKCDREIGFKGRKR